MKTRMLCPRLWGFHPGVVAGDDPVPFQPADALSVQGVAERPIWAARSVIVF